MTREEAIELASTADLSTGAPTSSCARTQAKDFVNMAEKLGLIDLAPDKDALLREADKRGNRAVPINVETTQEAMSLIRRLGEALRLSV